MILPLELGIETAASNQLGSQLAKLKGTAQQMEAQFVKEMLQAMKKAMPDTSEGEGFGNDEYQDMFDDAVSKEMSKKTGLGIAQAVYKSLEPTAIAETLKQAALKAHAAKITGGKS
jgi:flagellar protein FlgJ